MNGGMMKRIGTLAGALALWVPSAVFAQTIPLGPASAPPRAAPARPAAGYARPANPPVGNAGRTEAAAPRLADLSPHNIGLQPLSAPRGAQNAPRTGGSTATGVGTVATPPAAQTGGGPGVPTGPGSTAGQILTPSLISMLAATPPAYATTTPPSAGGARSSGYGTTPARAGGEGRTGTGALGLEILQPNVLEEPREFAPPGQMLPVLALDEATLLGGVARPLPAAAAANVPTGLADDALAVLPNSSLAPTSLAWEDGGTRLADLSPQVVPFGPLGPEAALGGFAPSRVMPWPNLGQRAGGVRPAMPATPGIPGYNPLTYGSNLGLALNSFAQIGAQLGAGLGSVGQLPQLPGLPAMPRY